MTGILQNNLFVNNQFDQLYITQGLIDVLEFNNNVFYNNQYVEILNDLTRSFFYFHNFFHNDTFAFDSSINSIPVWFALDIVFQRATHLTINNFNDGNYVVLSTITDTINGIMSAQFDSISIFQTGGLFIKAYSSNLEDTPINIHVLKYATIKLAPNSANEQIFLSIDNSSLRGRSACILDIYGRIIYNFT